MAQLRFHPLLGLEGVGLLRGTFFCIVFGLGCGCDSRRGSAQTVVADYFVHAKHVRTNTATAQCPNVGVAVVAIQDSQQPCPQDINKLGALGLV